MKKIKFNKINKKDLLTLTVLLIGSICSIVIYFTSKNLIYSIICFAIFILVSLSIYFYKKKKVEKIEDDSLSEFKTILKESDDYKKAIETFSSSLDSPLKIELNNYIMDNGNYSLDNLNEKEKNEFNEIISFENIEDAKKYYCKDEISSKNCNKGKGIKFNLRLSISNIDNYIFANFVIFYIIFIILMVI